MMKNLLNDKNEGLLEIVSETMDQIIADCVKEHGVSVNDFRSFTGGDDSKVKAIVYYQSRIVFRFGVKAGEGLDYFLEMTKDQASDVFSSYFNVEGEVA